jgi:hypothetical protein
MRCDAPLLARHRFACLSTADMLIPGRLFFWSRMVVIVAAASTRV